MAIVAGTKLIYDGMGGGGAPDGAYIFKGSVDTYNDLEDISDAWTDEEKEANAGWVYNVTDTGKNYAWNGTEWDSIGGDFAGSASINITSSGGNNVITVAGAPGAASGTFGVSNGAGSFTWRKPQVSDLSDVNATATELNYTSGVTSNIQTQLNSKANTSDIGNATITLKSGTRTIGSFTTNQSTDDELDIGATGSGLVDDVQINGTTIVDTNKVANIPIGTSSVLGVYKVNPNQGVSAFSAGDLCIIPANENELIAKTQGYKPIVPNTLDKAIREGLGNNSLTWTDEYKSNARNTIEATQVVLKDW